MIVEWADEALADLHQIFDYILEDNPAAAVAIEERIREAASMLADHPGIGKPGRVNGTRELVIPDQPYVLPYKEGIDRVFILRVLHTSKQWPARF